MHILLKVNQAEALRQGINAPHSTVSLDVDPEQLTATERAVLAAVLDDGHDATKRGIQSEPDEIVGQYQRSSQGNPTDPMVLIRPDLSGLKEAIAAMLEQREAKRAGLRASRQTIVNQAVAALEETLARRPAMNKSGLNHDGTLKTWCSEPVIWFEYPHTDTDLSWSGAILYLPEPDAARYAAWKARVEAENEAALAAAIEAAKPRLAQALAERRAKEEADAVEAAVQEAQRAAFLFQLPEQTKRRIDAGYATEQEVNKLLRTIARQEAGLPHEGGFRPSFKLADLTDEEFTALEVITQHVRRRLPNAEVAPMALYDDGGPRYRQAEAGDDPDAIDQDGEVWEDGLNERRRIVVTWQAAGLNVKAVIPFDWQPPATDNTEA